MVALTLLFFASAQDAVRQASLAYTTDAATLPVLAVELAIKYPALEAVFKSSGWAVNEEMVAEDEVQGWTLAEGDVVAVLPPVSGG